MIDSPIFAHLASADLAELGRILGRVYVRFSAHGKFENELDASGESEAECASMKIELNGPHATARVNNATEAKR